MKSKHKSFTLETKYDAEASEKGLIRITPTTLDAIVFTADEMLELIATDVRKKDVALALTSTDVEHLLMTMISRRFTCTAPKDMKAGESISFDVEQPYPVVLAVLEAEYNLCKIGESEFKSVHENNITDGIKALAEKNKEFLEKMYKKTLDKVVDVPEEKTE